MHRDIDEEPIRDWADFDAYCEGATVAPAAVFLFVLTARADADRLESALDEAALFDAARPMALFCYLVHILRDLAKDAERGGQLVTLPADRLVAHGLTRDGLAAAVRDGQTGARTLAREIAGRAAPLRAETGRVRVELAPHLGPRARAILGALTGVYERLHDRLQAGDPALDPESARDLKAAVFAEQGLDRWRIDEGEGA